MARNLDDRIDASIKQRFNLDIACRLDQLESYVNEGCRLSFYVLWYYVHCAKHFSQVNNRKELYSRESTSIISEFSERQRETRYWCRDTHRQLDSGSINDHHTSIGRYS